MLRLSFFLLKVSTTGKTSNVRAQPKMPPLTDVTNGGKRMPGD